MAPFEKRHLSDALEILGRVPLIDGHNDWPHLIRGFYDNKIDERFEPERDLVGHVDLKRLLQGRSGGAFWSAYVDCPLPEDDFSDQVHHETVRDTLQQIDLIHRLVDKYKDHMAIVNCSDDVLKTFRKGKFSCLLGVEGLHQIGNSSSVLRTYHRLGVRYVTLAHNSNNRFADSATAKCEIHGGLSSAGKKMVREMNRIGMMIDLSHCSEATVIDAFNTSIAPMAFTHSSANGLVQSPRNVTDLCLEKLKDNNGIIMISLIPQLTHSDAESATTTHVVDHILHVANKIGYDHIGIGSDFDGMERAVKGAEDVSMFPHLVATMLAKGIAECDVEKIIGLNVIRVLKATEQVARNQGRGFPVLEDPVKQLWSDDFRAFVRSVYPEAEQDHRC